MAENQNDAPESAPHGSAYDAEAPEHPLNDEVSAPEGEGPAAETTAPARRSRGYGQKFTLLVAALGLLATAAGGAAIIFKDKDERLRAVADRIEAVGRDPKAFFVEGQEALRAWLAKNLPGGEAERGAQRDVAKKTAPPTMEAAPPQARTSESSPPVSAPGLAPQKEPPPPAPDEPAAKLEGGAPAAPTERPAAVPAPAAGSGELAALAKRLDSLEGGVREARDAAIEARRLASAKPTENGGKSGSEASESASRLEALEARVEDLSAELDKLRAQLSQPKAETRVAPEADQALRAAQNKALAGAETLALTESLLHAFERGRPFAGEFAELKGRGADPQLLAALAPYAERGAPTGKELLNTFTPVAKRLRTLEDAAPPGASVTEQLLHDAGKLLRVRRVGEGAKPLVEEIVPQIEKALAREDLEAANEAFAKMPDAARAQAKEFGDSLEQRRAAERAASSLRANAIAGLSRAKD
jgi:hypothetical protein